jgi:hypothetical protein
MVTDDPRAAAARERSEELFRRADDILAQPRPSAEDIAEYEQHQQRERAAERAAAAPPARPPSGIVRKLTVTPPSPPPAYLLRATFTSYRDGLEAALAQVIADLKGANAELAERLAQAEARLAQAEARVGALEAPTVEATPVPQLKAIR